MLGAIGVLLIQGCNPAETPAGQGVGGKEQTLEAMAQNKKDLPKTTPKAVDGKEVAIFGGGCFWCVEAVLEDLKGVDTVISGYAGGFVDKPTYQEVCAAGTGHAEVVEVVFDPKVISYADLLRVFMTTHDPTTLNRQGNDVGPQYRSAIFYLNEEQEKTAKEVVAELDKEKVFKNPIVTEVTEFSNFYAAEQYHQDYYKNNPDAGYCSVVIGPKVAKMRATYFEKLKK